MVCKEEMALSQVQAALRGALSPGPYDPADPMTLEVSVTDRDATWRLWEVPTGDF